MRETKIRWADATWNPQVGCTEISPGCDNCYARVLTTRYGPTSTAFPNGFEPTFKPHKLPDPGKWLRGRGPLRIFVNSLSDVHHEAFTWEQIADVYDAMLATPEHDYLVLTKRPERMAGFMHGSEVRRGNRSAPLAVSDRGVQPTLGAEDEVHAGWLDARGLLAVPRNIWLGTSIESDRYVYRADWLRLIDVPVRFLSCEPLLGPLPSLDLDGIGWVIAGGESGPGYRVMDHDWARDLRDRCDDNKVAYYFKQSSGPRTEMGIELDGERREDYPFPHPREGRERRLGRYPSEAMREQREEAGSRG